MTAILTMLRERAEQFETHYSLAVAIEQQIFGGEQLSIGSTQLSVRHLLTMKSGLVVHLYNIVEATMSRIVRTMGTAFGDVPPSDWSVEARREWLRAHGAFDMDGHENERMSKVDKFSLLLIAGGPPKTRHLAKPKGNWQDKLIVKFENRFGVRLDPAPELLRKMAIDPALGEKTPMVYLADRRNALAHGDRSFEDAEDLTLARIREIADVALEYMEFVVNAFQQYVDEKRYVAAR